MNFLIPVYLLLLLAVAWFAAALRFQRWTSWLYLAYGVLYCIAACLLVSR